MVHTVAASTDIGIVGVTAWFANRIVHACGATALARSQHWHIASIGTQPALAHSQHWHITSIVLLMVGVIEGKLVNQEDRNDVSLVNLIATNDHEDRLHRHDASVTENPEGFDDQRGRAWP